MNGTEIINFLSDNFSIIMSAVGSVTGGLFTAIFLRHNTATAEFEKIKAGQFKEVADDLLKSGKMTYTEYYKANNFLSIAKKADEYYSKMDNNANPIYDFDWFVRFYEAVGNISDDTMQELWAKILAGEISRPSSFSLKTIDTLRNIGKKEAELFVKVCAHSFMLPGSGTIFLPNNDKYLKKYGIQYTDIMKLNEQGLIFNDGTIGSNYNINKSPQIIFTTRDLIMTIASTDGKDMSTRIALYPFTQVGIEIASLMPPSTLEECFFEFGRQLAQKNRNYSLEIHRIIQIRDDYIQYNRDNLLNTSATDR